MSKVKKLTKLELRTLESNHDKLAISNLKLSNLQKDISILELRQEVFKNQIAILNAEIQKTVEKANKEKSVKAKIERENKEEIETIKSKYSIKEQFGYDPDSGEIKEN